MRVLHVVASLAPRHGGPTSAAFGMVSALREQGVDASLLSSDDDVGAALDVPLNEWTTRSDVPVLYLPRVQARQHTLVGFTYTPGMKDWLRMHVRDYDFIHIHTVFSHPANVAMREARRAGVPYAVRPLGQLCRWSMQQRGWVKRLQLALVTRRNIDGAAFIHTTAAMESEETAELGFKSPCRVLAHGIDMPPEIPDARLSLRQELGVPSDMPVVVFMSRFHEKKGIELLLRACTHLTCFKLVLAGVGDPPYEARLRALVTELKLDDHVHWHGFVEGDAKWRLLQGSDLFVLPSYSENFGIAVLEAVACGLPVLISDQVALADDVRLHRVGRVTALDDLPGALAAMMADDSELADIRLRARKVAAEHFSWPAAARRLIQAYESAIGDTPKHS